MSLIFEWDTRKAATNARNHGIEFQEAIAVFDDPLARIFPDVWHSQHEPREIIIGHLRDRRLCLVVFTDTGYPTPRKSAGHARPTHRQHD